MTFHTRATDESAFTLLEVLVVLTLLSLIGTGLAIGLKPTEDRVRVAEADSWLENLVTSLRDRSRREGRSRAVEFDLEENRYRLSDSAWQDIPSRASWSLKTHGGSAGTPAITFLSDGSATAAELAIRSGSIVLLRRVDSLTGLIYAAPR